MDKNILIFSKSVGTKHGGSLILDATVQSLVADGWEVKIATESNTYDNEEVDLIVINNFYSKNVGKFFWKIFDIAAVIRVVNRETVILVNGDLPRLTYILLQLFFVVIFSRQDNILTCPANNRVLSRGRTICVKPVGFSCLAVNRIEGCLTGIGLIQSIGRIVFRMRDRYLLRLIKNFLCLSEQSLRSHDRSGRVIYPPLLAKEAPRPIGRDLHRLVFCGRLDGVKGGIDVVAALRMLPDYYSLIVLGDGPERRSLERSAETWGIRDRVEFRGWVGMRERDEVFASVGAIVVPSIWDEAFGMIGIEAFAQGTPAVAYEVGGIPEWCRQPAGILVRVGDVGALSEAVLAATRDPLDWKKRSAAARRIASEFSRERFERDLETMLDHALRKAS